MCGSIYSIAQLHVCFAMITWVHCFAAEKGKQHSQLFLNAHEKKRI